MFPIQRSFIVISLVTLAACATGHDAMRGSVVMKVSDTEAHVCLFDGDARIGARVQLYRHTCVTQYGKRYHCDKRRVAVGTVAEQLSDHYALVTFPPGTAFEEGYTVEPIN